jgi:hypothetical protein
MAAGQTRPASGPRIGSPRWLTAITRTSWPAPMKRSDRRSVTTPKPVSADVAEDEDPHGSTPSSSRRIWSASVVEVDDLAEAGGCRLAHPVVLVLVVAQLAQQGGDLGRRAALDVVARHALDPQRPRELVAVVALEAEHRAPDGEPVVDDVAVAVRPALEVPRRVGRLHGPLDVGADIEVAGRVLVNRRLPVGAVDAPVELGRDGRRVGHPLVRPVRLGVALDERGDGEQSEFGRGCTPRSAVP